MNLFSWESCLCMWLSVYMYLSCFLFVILSLPLCLFYPIPVYIYLSVFRRNRRRRHSLRWVGRYGGHEGPKGKIMIREDCMEEIFYSMLI